MRIFATGRWSRLWPYDGLFARSFRHYGVLAMVPFPSYCDTPRREMEEIVEIFKPDLLFLGIGYRGERDLSFDFLSKLVRPKRSRTKVVARHGETYFEGGPLNQMAFINVSSSVDVVYTISPSLLKEAQGKGAKNFKVLTGTTDIEVYYPVEAPKSIDLLFLGHSKHSRTEVLVELDKHFDLWVGGNFYEGSRLKHLFKGAWGEDFNLWNSKAKIALCLIPDEHKHLEQYYTGRLVNSLATGTFALTTYTPGLENIFTRKVHLDWYESQDELFELCQYWLAHDEEREKVAETGMSFVRQNLTHKIQAGQILRDVGLL